MLVPDNVDSFVSWLSKLDAGALARLRRSLAFEPGEDVTVYPYVEPFVESEKYPQPYYLAAGLFALVERAPEPGRKIQEKADSESSPPAHSTNFGATVASILKPDQRDQRAALESRFLHLLNAEFRELPQSLRQMVKLCHSKNAKPDWAQLLRDLKRWGHPSRSVQKSWAKKFFQVTDQTEGDAHESYS